MKAIALLLGLIATVSSLEADEATIGRIRATLPEGYQHVPAKGIDTAVGCFQPADGSCEIRYDIGPGSGSGRAGAFAEKHADRVDRDKKIETGLGQGRFVAIRLDGDAKFAAMFEARGGVNFYAINLTKKQVDDFEAIVGSLLMDPEPKPKKQEAEQE